jgi:hypothetical protein
MGELMDKQKMSGKGETYVKVSPFLPLQKIILCLCKLTVCGFA